MLNLLHYGITLRHICIYYYLLFNALFSNISIMSWSNFNSTY